MTKLIYITTIGLLLCSSCITNVAEIRVSSLETLCDHVEALGEIYDKMEEIMGVTLMDAKSEKKFFEIFVKVTENEEEFEALLIKEAEMYSKKHGWKKDRHEEYPTTDNQFTKKWKNYSLIVKKIRTKIISRCSLSTYRRGGSFKSRNL